MKEQTSVRTALHPSIAISYPQELPVVEKRAIIANAIRENQVIVLCGETGSGKTTQLPKICLELGRGTAGMIGHTQPRRIAARSIAARIAQELDTTVGQAVGYKIRFSDKVSESTYIKIMTDGILLAETQADHLLRQYDTIIIDEAHERSLNIDFLLGYLKQLLPTRLDLKLIITSATIDPQRFSEHFDNAPILEISGRTYPVELRYRPVEAGEADDEDRLMEQAILQAVDELWRAGPGDVLIFLSGEREIRETAEAMRKHHPPDTEILPLYARLSAAEQMRIFQPHTRARIVLATNVAETSLTVPGIKYVIDPGYARISRYSPRTKVQRLPIERISRASADQRMGRCGRVSEGVCIRLYSEDDYQARPQFTDPEILRTNLASVILQMKALRLGSVQDFPFLQPPDYRSVRDGYQTLHELGAIDEKNELTPLGRDLAKLPIDPRIGRMVLEAAAEDCLSEVLIIAAALSIQDPRERPLDRQEQADEAHKKFRAENSDFLGYLKLWDFFHENAAHLSTNKLRKLCQDNFLSFVRMREWHDVQQQLHGIASQTHFARAGRMQANSKDRSPYDRIHRAILAGLLGNIGTKSDVYEYTGAGGKKFAIFPGSSLFKVTPPWLVAAELVETTRLYARTAAAIQPRWIEQLAAHLVQRSYSDPHWRRDAGQVIAFERVMLYGLPIVQRRRIHYGPIDAKLSREIFIERALVHGDYATDAQYFRHNRDLVRELELMEAKTRKPNILADAKTRFAFYDARIPRHVYSAQLFERWRAVAEENERRLLSMTRDELMLPDAPPFDAAMFPDVVKIDETDLRLDYLHEPGDAADGVTLNVPLAMLNQLRPEQFEWLVPGMLAEKVIALIRTLPRPLRTQLVPAPDIAAAAVASIQPDDGPLLEALAAQLGRISGLEISPDAFDPGSLPAPLRMNFRVFDAAGGQIAMGRDLADLRRKLGVRARNIFQNLPPSQFNRGGITRWDFGDLPSHVPVRHQQMTLNGFPGIVDEGATVALRLFDNAESARQASRRGVLRLFMLQVDQELESIVRRVELEQMCLHYGTLGGCDQLRGDLLFAIAVHAFGQDESNLRTQAQFIEQAAAGWRHLEPAAAEVIALAEETLRLFHELTIQLGEDFAPMLLASVDDLREQLRWLITPHFLIDTPFEWLQHLPRYLKGIHIRLRKLLNAGLARDVEQMAQVKPHWQTYLRRKRAHDEHGIHDPALEQYRWMIEELRVSVFAQELKTALPVSSRRLEEQWSQVRAEQAAV